MASPEGEDRAAANATAVGSRQTRGVDCDFGFFECSRFTWAINSRSLAQPWKSRQSISKVRRLGLRPVQSTINTLAIGAS